MKTSVAELIFQLADVIAKHIRKGRRLHIVLGMICCSAGGALLPFPTVYWRVVAAVVGALTGAVLAAAVFRRPPSPASWKDAVGQVETCGSVLRSWSFTPIRDAVWIVVLMERTIYCANGHKLNPTGVVSKLAANEDPEVPGAALIGLNTIESIEFRRPDDTDVNIEYQVAGQQKRRHGAFATVMAREEFLHATEQLLGKQFVGGLVRVDLVRAIWAPAICLLAVAIVATLLSGLSSHWRAFPPPPPLGKLEQDALVRLLTWAGPTGIARIAAVPLVALALWFTLRIVRPPRVYRLMRFHSELLPIDPQVDVETSKYTDIAEAEESLRRSRQKTDRLVSVIGRIIGVLIVVTGGLLIYASVLALGEMAQEEAQRQALEEQQREAAMEKVDAALRAGPGGAALQTLFPQAPRQGGPPQAEQAGR